MTDLERRYRRWLTCYPRHFRAEHEDELLTVLLAVSHVGQRHPSIAEVAALVRSALRMRLRSRGVLLLCAVLELATWATLLTTPPHLSGAAVTDLVVAPVLAVAWLVLAWGRDRRWAPGGVVALTILTTVGLISGLSAGAAAVAPADTAVGVALWAAAVLAMILTLRPIARRRTA